MRKKAIITCAIALTLTGAIKAGETQKVQITIPNRNLSFVDEAGARRIAPGTVQVWAGGGQPVGRQGLPKSAGVSGSFKISKAATLPN